MLRRAAAVDYLTLVNAERPWRPDERLRLVPVNRQDKGVMLQSEAACQLNRLLQQLTGSAEAGWQQIAAVSGWRSRQEQRRIWWQSLAENGREFTEQYVARPGCSEHQTGLAIDLGWRFRQLAAEYGFVERYPQGKEAVCGIAHEPWHFRYVGRPHALIMQKRGLTLEEYLQ